MGDSGIAVGVARNGTTKDAAAASCSSIDKSIGVSTSAARLARLPWSFDETTPGCGGSKEGIWKDSGWELPRYPAAARRRS